MSLFNDLGPDVPPGLDFIADNEELKVPDALELTLGAEVDDLDLSEHFTLATIPFGSLGFQLQGFAPDDTSLGVLELELTNSHGNQSVSGYTMLKHEDAGILLPIG